MLPIVPRSIIINPKVDSFVKITGSDFSEAPTTAMIIEKQISGISHRMDTSFPLRRNPICMIKKPSK
jgi:hypothetical protein